MDKRLFIKTFCITVLLSVSPLMAGTSTEISPSTVYDLSLSYLAVGVSDVVAVGVTTAVQISSEDSGDVGTSIKLGEIGLLNDGQTAGIEWSVTGPGILAFDWKLSSEADWDWLRFYEAGSGPTNQISGIFDWSRMSVTVTGASDLNHTFRWEYEKDPVGYYVGLDCGWLDAISWTLLYAMTVNNGSGDGYYTNNAYASIIADTAAAHYEFDRWTGDTNTVSNVFAVSTTLRMPNTNALVTATYKPTLYTLSASNASGGGTYPYATTVEIRASAFENMRFLCWTGDVTSVADVNAAITTVVTSDHTISVAATYSVPLTITSGTGSGWYPEGSTTTVSADDAPMWKEFIVWTGDVGLLSNANARTTTLTLQTAPATVTATYKDSISRLTGSYGRTYSESGTSGAITPDPTAGSPSGTPAVKLGGAGIVPDNGFAAFETIVSGSGSILFQWKASSELNGDYLKFKVDGAQVAAISGTRVPWTQVSNRVNTAGSHTLRWEYAKNSSSASNIDAGWVDDIVWVGDTQAPVLTPVIVHAALTNQHMEIQFTGERGMTYLVQTNGTLDHAGWSDYQTLQPTWLNESNGIHRFEITPPANSPDKLFYRIVTPSDMVLVQGGALTNIGNGAISVDSFYIGKYEITWAEWQTVRDWAATNGYDIGSVGAGNADNHPVQTVSWCDCVKWCNARSQKEGRTPVYYTDEGLTLVYKTTDVLYPFVNASATGYRLPTDTEWEFAARGGTQSTGYIYSGGNDVNAVAWYLNNSGGSDKAVGTKLSNELGLYDMSGNVWEWCFDWYPGSEGWLREARGGSCSGGATLCLSGFRGNPVISDGRFLNIGFRIAMTLP